MMKHSSSARASARLRLGAWICAGFLAAGAGPAMAQGFSPDQGFSADIVMTKDNAAVPAGHLLVLDARVRIETPDFPNAFFLVDAAKPSAYFVRPAMHTFMDSRQSSQLTRLFVPVDPEQPCRQWQAMAQLAGVAGQGDWRCERSGEEAIDGTNAIVFRVSTGPGREYLGWIDPVRKFPLRIRTEEGTTFALEHIRDEPQPASSFELPPGLRKFSPEALVEQIKQSDVWVSAPSGGAASPR
jgi:hypothetical protein